MLIGTVPLGDTATMRAIRASRPIPDRLRGAALAMILGTLMWALMPIGSALGLNFSQGIGVFYVDNSAQIVVNQGMLVWLAPLSLATTIAGLFVYWGRGLVAGLALGLVWLALGVASMSVLVVIVAALVTYCIFTGRRRMLARSIPKA
jgi:hypothetical protein